MTNEEQVAEKITELLMLTAPESRWPMNRPQMCSAITQILRQSKSEFIQTELTAWQESVQVKLRELIKDWEIKMPDDSTLYSLGLRHAEDIVHGREVES